MSRAVWIAGALLSVLACRPVEEHAEERAQATAREPAQRATDAAEEPVAQTPPPHAAASLPNFARVAEQLAPSVVSVVATLGERGSERGEAPRTIRGIGSGMIVSARGQVLTNQHAVAEATAVDIELANRTRARARVVYADPLLDLALLELESPAEHMTPVVFRARQPQPGEWVMAVGQPYGLGNTVTVGVISGLGRDHDDLGRPGGLARDGFWSFIQTDTPVNTGNSGGPLVDVHGEVVGLTTAVLQDGQGLAFAIPAEMARKFLEEVWTYGRVRHVRLGIRADNAGPEDFPGRLSAVRIKSVAASGPGDKAGLEVGDFVLAVNDRPISRVSELAYYAQLLGVGARARLTVKRGEAPLQQLLIIPAEAI
ncbi:MAG: trypsin-like peptidase domain-containing protein [Myxococcales bacterium]|nr:trypsin-like peptidase domain-containing protein [Myxococcales bacterium]